MFNSIRGKVTEKREGAVYLDCNGVEWDIGMSAQSLSALPEVGQTARVFTYLHHRDDQMRLYGFAEPAERSVFLDLLKVGGIGPKQALKALSGLPFSVFLKALDDGDVEGLSRVPGLGKKTAQKIVLALRGRLSLRSEESGGAYAELVDALVEMGFDRREAAEAVSASAQDISLPPGDPQFEKELMRLSIVRLSE